MRGEPPVRETAVVSSRSDVSESSLDLAETLLDGRGINPVLVDAIDKAADIIFEPAVLPLEQMPEVAFRRLSRTVWNDLDPHIRVVFEDSGQEIRSLPRELLT